MAGAVKYLDLSDVSKVAIASLQLGAVLVVPSISPTSSALSALVSVTSSSLQWSLPIAGNRHQSWSSCCLSSLISPVLLLPQHLSQCQLLQFSSAATTQAFGAVPAVYTTVEDTAVVIAGTIHNLDLSDASKLLLLYFSLLQYL